MTSSNARTPRLPARAEALLADWPAPTRGALAWEETATEIMAKVRATTPGSTPDDLLDAPLPEEPDELGRTPADSESKTEEPSMAEIARAALSGRDAASRDVARDGLIAAEQGRKALREATPAAPETRTVNVASLQGRVTRGSIRTEREQRPASTGDAAKAAALVASPVEAAHAPVQEAAARSVMPLPPSSTRARHLGPVVFGGAALAIAAAAALFISVRHAKEEPPLTASAEAPFVAHQSPTAPAEPAAKPEASATPSAPTTPPSAVALDELKTIAKSAAPIAKDSLAFRVKKETSKTAGKLVLEERTDDAPVENAPPATQNAAPVAQSAPAAPATLAEEPSLGAVQAAFGAVLTSARSCVVGQDSGPRATVTFDGRTGRVKSVALEGVSAGSPAESCVRSALMGARVQPFSEPTYTAKVTVHPL